MKKWIQKSKLKKGGLHRQLGIEMDDKIPKTLLNKIVKAKAGDTIKNPTKEGKKRIKMTRLLERRAIFAKTSRKFKR